MEKNKDNIIPKDKWEFDEEVTNVFEDMLERSIPAYSEMRKLCLDMSDALLLKNKKMFNLLDLGCSNGLNLELFVKRYGAHGHYTCVDCSTPMLEDLKVRFKNYIDLGLIRVENMDLRKEFPRGCYDVITAVLCLLFVPIQYRHKIIQEVYDNLDTGGVFIFVEKVLGNSAKIDDALVSNYYKYKENHGYSKEAIERKRLSLEGVQVPITSNWNIDLLKSAGFRQVDVFWRYLNFEGYVAIK